MSKFKDFYLNEGRNRWDIFELAQTDKRWSFKNIQTGQRYFLKLGEKNHVGQIQKFLMDINARNENKPKTFGKINFNELAQKLVSKEKGRFHVKSGHWDTIKSTWVI